MYGKAAAAAVHTAAVPGAGARDAAARGGRRAGTTTRAPAGSVRSGTYTYAVLRRGERARGVRRAWVTRSINRAFVPCGGQSARPGVAGRRGHAAPALFP